MDNISPRHIWQYDSAIDAENTDSRSGRKSDLFAAASGHGGYCPDGIPVELALCLLLAAFAIAFGILYRAVTKITARRRRKRGYTDIKSLLEDYQDRFADFVWWGRSHMQATE